MPFGFIKKKWRNLHTKEKKKNLHCPIKKCPKRKDSPKNEVMKKFHWIACPRYPKLGDNLSMRGSEINQRLVLNEAAVLSLPVAWSTFSRSQASLLGWGFSLERSFFKRRGNLSREALWYKNNRNKTWNVKTIFKPCLLSQIWIGGILVLACRQKVLIFLPCGIKQTILKNISEKKEPGREWSPKYSFLGRALIPKSTSFIFSCKKLGGIQKEAKNPGITSILREIRYRVTHEKVRTFLDVLRPKKCSKMLGVLIFRK